MDIYPKAVLGEPEPLYTQSVLNRDREIDSLKHVIERHIQIASDLEAQLASARRVLEIADDFAWQVAAIEDVRHNDGTKRIAETYREIFRNSLAVLTK